MLHEEHVDPMNPFGHEQVPFSWQLPPFKQDQNPPLLHPLSLI